MRSCKFLLCVMSFSAVASTRAERYFLLAGVDVGHYPGASRIVPPRPGPGFPGTFNDGDRLAGTLSDAGPPVIYQGNDPGGLIFQPNQFGALSFQFKRGSVPVGGPNRLPFMGIDFLGGPLLDLDGNPGDGARSLVPVPGGSPVILPHSDSYIELGIDTAAGTIGLINMDASASNEGAPGLGPDVAAVLVTLAGTNPDGSLGPAINPAVDTRSGTVTAQAAGVHRIQDLGFEFWQDSTSSTSSTASVLGTMQYLGRFSGWLVTRDPQTGAFPTLAGTGIGSTLWPAVDTADAGTVLNTANGLAGGSATIAIGVGGDDFSDPNNGGIALADFGGDLGGYLDTVVAPHVPANAYRYVYLEAAGIGINNSFDPVYGDTVGYDTVLIGAAVCAGDVDGSGTVNLSDLASLLAAFGAAEGDPGFNPGADLDRDGTIGLSDLATLLANFGGACS